MQSDSKFPLVETKDGFFPILFNLVHKIASFTKGFFDNLTYLINWSIWFTTFSISNWTIRSYIPSCVIFGIRAVLMNLWSFNLYLLMASKPFSNALPHCRNRCQYCRLMKCLSVGMRSDCEYKKALLVCWELILNWIWSGWMKAHIKWR